MNKCLTGIHKFKPRYDELPSGYEIETVRGITAESLRSLMIRQIYVKDICVRCGKSINRNNNIGG